MFRDGHPTRDLIQHALRELLSLASHQRYHSLLGIAFTNGPVKFTDTLRCDTGAHLIADLDAFLLLVNWTHAAVITNGFIYTLTSPQTFPLFVSIQDVGNAGQPPSFSYSGHIVIQCMDNTSGLNAGWPHWIGYGYGQPYLEAVADQCQLFLALPAGGTPPTFGAATSVAVGVPYVGIGTGPCTTGVNPITVSTVWWSCGAGAQNGIEPDFRTAWAALLNFSYSLNGVTTLAPQSPPNPNQYSGMLNVFPLTPTNLSAQVVKYGFLTPLMIDPFIGWLWAIYGQLWDALLLTAIAGAQDSQFSTVEVNSGGGNSIADWIVWGYENDGLSPAGTYFGTLCLLTAPPSGGGVFAYAY